MTRERPILFSAPMVRAILAGRKTQTRRVAKFVPLNGSSLAFSGLEPGHYCTGVPSSGSVLYARRGDGVWDQKTEPLHCPYGLPGDRLWVRETWASDRHNCGENYQPEDEDHRCTEHCNQTYVYYRATPRSAYRPVPDKARITLFDETTPLPDGIDDRKWSPSIFMPRWASRITLEVTEIRVQRVQDISEDDARAEGPWWAIDEEASLNPSLHHRSGDGCYACSGDPNGIAELCHDMLRGRGRPQACWYANVWDDINGKRPGCDWKSNPWVWAVSFKRLP